jgi:uncharacterized protein involved in type VI secretion and phage assembly
VRPIFDLQSLFTEQIQAAELHGSRNYDAMIAIVTDNKDPSKLGRVKVKLPVLSDKDTTWWAPIIMLGAGKNRGWFFIPEIDDEVLVMFEHGNVDYPVVIGALWGGKDKPPDKNPGGNPRRLIKSRAGSKLTFDDEKGTITIEDGKGTGKITFDSGSNKITIEAMSGDVCFQSPQGDLQIVAQEVELTATQSLEIHAGSTMGLGTDAMLTIKGQSITMSGAKVNMNCGMAQMPSAPSSDPKDVDDPYKS